ncbi:hypothetical protein vBYenSP400_48 [Yersinia phage vB_YenS_P400]|nr:hypothetical protein vBYenSP400_48 [Yersinia phage vB_YenS_P400]
MALVKVKILTDNLYAGANLQKLEVGSVVEVEESTAKNWITYQNAELYSNQKAERILEVATPDDEPRKPKRKPEEEAE